MECNGCTECCFTLPVPDVNKRPGEQCAYCDVGEGCSIWENRPPDCRVLRCAYYQAPKASIDLRPDKCHVIFERIGEIMLGTMHPDHNNAYKSPIMKDQKENFLKQGFSVVFNSYTMNNPIIFPANGRTKEEVYRDLWQVRRTQQI